MGVRPADAAEGRRLELPLRALLAPAAAGAAVVLLAVRLVHDLGVKPYYEDEAVAGLIASRPLGEVLHTVLWDRGGSPLHFVLAHFVFALSPTAEALRWLSLACALGAVVVTYFLARELAGAAAGVGAAWIVAASDLLRIYGTFGRMYSLLALMGGLNMLLFLRALDRPTGRRVTLAAASAWLLAATHPFAAIPVVVEAAVALYLWRGRGWRRAGPVFVAAVAAVPFALAELRLASRFDVSTSGGVAIGGRGAANERLGAAVQGFAGGHGLTLALFVALALLGAWVVARRSPFLLLVGASALLVPPALSLLAHVSSSSTAYLSPRHLLVALPLWAALIGVGAVSLARRSGDRRLPVLAVVAVAVLAVRAPAAASDPRTIYRFWAATGEVASTDTVGAWLAQRIEPGDLLFPYAVPYLQALPEARVARSLPRGDAPTLLAAIGNGRGARQLWVTLPLGPSDRLRPDELDVLERSYAVTVFPTWIVVRVPGPFANRRQVVTALARAVDSASAAVIATSPNSWAYEQITRSTVNRANRIAGTGF
jgi:hypothetical protein